MKTLFLVTLLFGPVSPPAAKAGVLHDSALVVAADWCIGRLHKAEHRTHLLLKRLPALEVTDEEVRSFERIKNGLDWGW